MVTDISKQPYYNPGTARITKGTGHATQHKLNQVAEDISKEIDGYVPGKERVNAGWKILGYHIANFFSAGMFHSFAGMIASSQYMKPDNHKAGWLKDIGQTHLNVAHGYSLGGFNEGKWNSAKGMRSNGAAFLSGMAEAYSWASVLPNLARYGFATRAQNRKRKEFVSRLNADSSTNATIKSLPKSLGHRFSTNNVMKMAAESKSTRKTVALEFNRMMARKPDEVGLKPKDLLRGHPAVRFDFIRHVGTEYSLENIYFLEAAEEAFKHLPTDPLQPDWRPDPKNPPQLRGIDVVLAHENLVTNKASLEINIPYAQRAAWNTLMAKPAMQKYRAEYKAKQNDLAAAEANLAKAPKWSPNFKLKKEVARCAAELDKVINTKLPIAESAEALKLMKLGHGEMYRLLQDSVNRYKNEHLDPELVKHENIQKDPAPAPANHNDKYWTSDLTRIRDAHADVDWQAAPRSNVLAGKNERMRPADWQDGGAQPKRAGLPWGVQVGGQPQMPKISAGDRRQVTELQQQIDSMVNLADLTVDALTGNDQAAGYTTTMLDISMALTNASDILTQLETGTPNVVQRELHEAADQLDDLAQKLDAQSDHLNDDQDKFSEQISGVARDLRAAAAMLGAAERIVGGGNDVEEEQPQPAQPDDADDEVAAEIMADLPNVRPDGLGLSHATPGGDVEISAGDLRRVAQLQKQIDDFVTVANSTAEVLKEVEQDDAAATLFDVSTALTSAGDTLGQLDTGSPNVVQRELHDAANQLDELAQRLDTQAPRESDDQVTFSDQISDVARNLRAASGLLGAAERDELAPDKPNLDDLIIEEEDDEDGASQPSMSRQASGAPTESGLVQDDDDWEDAELSPVLAQSENMMDAEMQGAIAGYITNLGTAEMIMEDARSGLENNPSEVVQLSAIEAGLTNVREAMNVLGAVGTAPPNQIVENLDKLSKELNELGNWTDPDRGHEMAPMVKREFTEMATLLQNVANFLR